MNGILMWMLNIALHAAAIVLVWIGVRHLIRNGGGTLSAILETITLWIRCKCLSMKARLLGELQEKTAEKEEPVMEQPDGPEVRVEGTVR